MDQARIHGVAAEKVTCDGWVRTGGCRRLGRREAWGRGRAVAEMGLRRLVFVTVVVVVVVGRTGLFAPGRVLERQVGTLRKGSRRRTTWKDPLCHCHLGSGFMWKKG